MRRMSTRWRSIRAAVAIGLAGGATLSLAPAPGYAVSIELRDVAADRIERQRLAAEGKLPLPNTPDLARFPERLSEKGLKAGAPILIRIFKAESELELWMQKDGVYVLFATYPICHWSGTLGPKLRAGDKQAPEGFYTVTRRQLHLAGRWPRSLNLGFPNVFDKLQARTGNYILVHGGCSSVGCYAMTNTVIEEIYSLTSAALAGGEEHVPVHVFPFRMTSANLSAHRASPWTEFWTNLKQGYDSFERTKLPPHVSVCDGKYQFRDSAPEEVGDGGPLGWCGATAAAVEDLERWYKAATLRPSLSQTQFPSRKTRALSFLADLRSRNAALSPVPTRAMAAAIMAPEPQGATAAPVELLSRLAASIKPPPPSCSLNRASCRKHVALQRTMATRKIALGGPSARRTKTARAH